MAAGKKYPVAFLDLVWSDEQASRFAGANCHLFTSDITPTAADTIGTYSGNEAAWTGYAPQSTSFGGVTDDGTHSYTDSAIMSFPVTSGGTGVTVYGYWIQDASNSYLIFAERIASPISVVDGFPVPLQVRLRLYNA